MDPRAWPLVPIDLRFGGAIGFDKTDKDAGRMGQAIRRIGLTWAQIVRIVKNMGQHPVILLK